MTNLMENTNDMLLTVTKYDTYLWFAGIRKEQSILIFGTN